MDMETSLGNIQRQPGREGLMNWSAVKHLHLEISSQCNAACPLCARYPTSSLYEHPSISMDQVWTIEQVRARLPTADLVNIEKFLINGTVGDFITNRDALEIIQHFSSASPTAQIEINTNGSARTPEFWKSLALIKNVRISFALDGLEDTHHLYRRQTNWKFIIDNAKTFINAGGTADWIMTRFAHNDHQVDECASLAKQLGFAKFYARHSDRYFAPARDKNGNTTHELLPAPTAPYTSSTRTLAELQSKEVRYRNGTFRAVQMHNSTPLPSLDNCESLRTRSIYVGADWSVAPCCFIGVLSFTRETDHRYASFATALAEAGLTLQDLIASTTVSAIVDRGFDWIYNRITTDRALMSCFHSCHPDKSNYRISQATKLAK